MSELNIQAILRELVEGPGEFTQGEMPDPMEPGALELGGNWVLATRLGRLDIMQWIVAYAPELRVRRF